MASSTASSSRRPVNMRNWAVKRIMQEAAELANPDEDGFVAAPLESDIFEWHCTVRGVPGTDYEGGLYHLRIVLPSTYPMSAPDILLMTPNGRFELNKKICIDGLTSFHAGSWQPAWGVRTAITGLRSFWTQDGEALSAIGALDLPKEERRRLAKLSRDWTCPTCQESNATLLPDPTPEAKTPGTAKEPTKTMKDDPPRGEKTGNTSNGTSSTSQPIEPPVEHQPTSASPPPPAPADRPLPLAAAVTVPQAITPEVAPAPTPAPIPAAADTVPIAGSAFPVPTPAPALRRATPANPPAPVTRTQQATPPVTRRSSPLWLDVLIGTLVALLAAMVLRR